MLIEGAKIDVAYKELKEQCDRRAVHHATQAEKHTERLKLLHERAGQLLEDDEVDDEVADYANNASNFKGMVQPDTVKRKALYHGKQADWFAFVASHLVEGSTYRLSLHEFEAFEFVRGAVR